MLSQSTGRTTRGSREYAHRRKTRTRTAGLVLWFSGAIHITPAFATWELNKPRGIVPLSQAAYEQHMLMLWWCAGIGMVVIGAMFCTLWRYRKSATERAAPLHHSTFGEIVWTAIPCLILVSMAIPAAWALINMGT